MILVIIYDLGSTMLFFAIICFFKGPIELLSTLLIMGNALKGTPEIIKTPKEFAENVEVREAAYCLVTLLVEYTTTAQTTSIMIVGHFNPNKGG